MLEKMKEKPWPIYKIKLGTQEDIPIIRGLREHTDSLLRVDANAAWTLEEALEKIPVLKSLGVELVEQPLAKEDWDGMKVLYELDSLPLVADESCVRESDTGRCKGFFHAINIKLTKCSGITPARRMIQDAKALNMKVMLGSMNESTVGTAAIANLLPLVDYVDMDGPLLLEEDVATGLRFDRGQVFLSGGPGLGIEFKGV
jgi:L-Ala-D/L-Glu epimerase